MIFWLALIVMAALLEWAAIHYTGASMSRHWWRTQRLHPWAKYAALAFLVLLTIHLVWGWP